MKKSTVKFTTTIILAFAFISLFTFQSCKSSKKSKPIKNRTTLVDYQGKKEGKEIPDWVNIYIEGLSGAKLKSAEAKLKSELGLKESDFIYWNSALSLPSNKYSVKDVLTGSKIHAYREAILHNEWPIYFFGLLAITQRTEKEFNLFLYDITPFGTMKFSSLSNTESGKVKEQRDIEIARKDENGRFLADFEQTGNFEPVSDEMQQIFEWFLDEKNVRIDQFWVETKQKKGKFTIAYTVMSMSSESHAWLENALNSYAENYENTPEYTKIERFIQKEMEK